MSITWNLRVQYAEYQHPHRLPIVHHLKIEDHENGIIVKRNNEYLVHGAHASEH